MNKMESDINNNNLSDTSADKNSLDSLLGPQFREPYVGTSKSCREIIPIKQTFTKARSRPLTAIRFLRTKLGMKSIEENHEKWRSNHIHGAIKPGLSCYPHAFDSTEEGNEIGLSILEDQSRRLNQHSINCKDNFISGSSELAVSEIFRTTSEFAKAGSNSLCSDNYSKSKIVCKRLIARKNYFRLKRQLQLKFSATGKFPNEGQVQLIPQDEDYESKINNKYELRTTKYYRQELGNTFQQYMIYQFCCCNPCCVPFSDCCNNNCCGSVCTPSPCCSTNSYDYNSAGCCDACCSPCCSQPATRCATPTRRDGMCMPLECRCYTPTPPPCPPACVPEVPCRASKPTYKRPFTPPSVIKKRRKRKRKSACCPCQNMCCILNCCPYPGQPNYGNPGYGNQNFGPANYAPPAGYPNTPGMPPPYPQMGYPYGGGSPPPGQRGTNSRSGSRLSPKRNTSSRPNATRSRSNFSPNRYGAPSLPFGMPTAYGNNSYQNPYFHSSPAQSPGYGRNSPSPNFSPYKYQSNHASDTNLPPQNATYPGSYPGYPPYGAGGYPTGPYQGNGGFAPNNCCNPCCCPILLCCCCPEKCPKKPRKPCRPCNVIVKPKPPYCAPCDCCCGCDCCCDCPPANCCGCCS